jgi:hypothetical protein
VALPLALPLALLPLRAAAQPQDSHGQAAFGPRDASQRVVRSALALAGRCCFAPSHVDNSGSFVRDDSSHFNRWMTGRLGRLSADGSMNCIDALLFSAYRAGVMSKPQIVGLHRRATAAGKAESDRYVQAGCDDKAPKNGTVAYREGLCEGLGYGGARPFSARNRLKPGDVVFFRSPMNLLGPEHVALALGVRDARGEEVVMSLWNEPRPEGDQRPDSFQRTTLQRLARVSGHAALVADAPWQCFAGGGSVEIPSP